MSRWAKISITLSMLAALAYAPSAHAALDYFVVLKDGSAYQGELVEYAPGDHVTIHLATGENRRFDWSKIELPAMPPSALPPPVAPPVDAPPPQPATSSVDSSPTVSIDPSSQATKTSVVVSVMSPGLGNPPAGADTTTVATNPGPRAGQWALDMRVPMTVTISDPSVALEGLGFDFGFGHRLTDDVYLGVFGGIGQEWNLGGGDPMVYAVTRAGGDLQIITHRGANQNDDGTTTPNGNYQFVGLRGGAEGVRSLTPTGGFAELDYGFGNIGFVMGAGLSFEPPGIFGSIDPGFDEDTPPTAPTRTVSPYLSASIRFGLGG